MTAETDPIAGIDLSLVRGGPFFRLQCALGLGPGRARRPLLIRLFALTAIAWLPVAIGALVSGRAWSNTPEPLYQHFGIHARCLIAIPLFVIAEGLAERVLPELMRYFVRSGLVGPGELEPFRAVLRSFAALRDSSWGRALLLGMMLMTTVGTAFVAKHHEEVSWAVTQQGSETSLGFAGLWYLWISRPLFVALGGLWLWRVIALVRLTRRIAGLDLRLSAAHPDRSAGLGFLDQLPTLFVPAVFGASVVVASRLAHEVLYHGLHVPSL